MNAREERNRINIKNIMLMLGAKQLGNSSLILETTTCSYSVRDFMHQIFGEDFISVSPRLTEDKKMKSTSDNQKSIDNKYSFIANHKNQGNVKFYRENLMKILDCNNLFFCDIRDNAYLFLRNYHVNEVLRNGIIENFIEAFSNYNKTHYISASLGQSQFEDILVFMLALSIIPNTEDAYEKMFSSDNIFRLVPDLEKVLIKKADNELPIDEQDTDYLLNEYYNYFSKLLSEFDFNYLVQPTFIPIPFMARENPSFSDKIILYGPCGSGKTHFLLYSFLVSMKHLGIDKFQNSDDTLFVESIFNGVDFNRLPIYIDIRKLPHKYLTEQSLLKELPLNKLMNYTTNIPDNLVEQLLNRYADKLLVLIDNADLLQNISRLMNPSASIIITGKGFHVGVKQVLNHYNYASFYILYSQHNEEKNYILSKLNQLPKYRKYIQKRFPTSNNSQVLEKIVNQTFFLNIQKTYDMSYQSLYQIFGYLFSEGSIDRSQVNTALMNACQRALDNKSEASYKFKDTFYDNELAKIFVDCSNLFTIPSDCEGFNAYYLPSNNIVSGYIIARSIVNKTRFQHQSKYSFISLVQLELSMIKNTSLILYVLFFIVELTDNEKIDLDQLSNFLLIFFSNNITYVEYSDISDKGIIHVVGDIFHVLKQKGIMFSERNIMKVTHAFTSFLPQQQGKELRKLVAIPSSNSDNLFFSDLFSFLAEISPKKLIIHFVEDKTDYESDSLQTRLYLFYIGLCISEANNIQIFCYEKDRAYLAEYFPTIESTGYFLANENTSSITNNQKLTAKLNIKIKDAIKLKF